MNFTKESAIKDLIAKLTTNGEKLNLSERSVNEQVEALLPLIANEEMELADFVDKVLPIVKTANANVGNDVAQGIKAYKDSNPIQEPAKNEPNPPADINEALLKRLEALEKQNQERAEALLHEGIKKNLVAEMKKLGISNDKWIEAMLNNLAISNDLDVSAQAQEYLEVFNSMFDDITPSMTPGSTGGSKPDYVSDTIAAAAAIAKQQSL